ncbi:flagellar M-ring protein [Clostridia bacterium]|nr:flagellar M-ring protein [Clostridia bacterium]
MDAVRAFFKRIWEQLKEYWVNTERKDRVRFIAISAVALIGIIVAAVMLTRTTYIPLYSTIDPADVKNVQDALSGQGIKHKLDSSGNIVVPEQVRQQAIYNLAQAGVPSSGNNYEYLMRGSGFSVSESEKNDWRRIQSQTDIQETLIAMNDRIDVARVEIAKPDNSNALWDSERAPVTASVTLRLNAPLSDEQVEGIIRMVAASFPELLTDNVFVTDQNMTILNPTDKEPPMIDVLMDREKIRLNYQTDLERQLTKLLVPLFGADHVVSAVNVEMGWDDDVTHEVVFTPSVDDGGIVVSMKELIEAATGGGSGSGGEPGIDSNGWEDDGSDISEYPETSSDAAASSWNSTSREINYNVNQRNHDLTLAKGTVKYLSASVVVDSNELAADNENSQKDIAAIVADAIGVRTDNENTNISVTIRAMSGRAGEQELRQSILDSQKRAELFELIKTLALYLVLGVCLALFIHRVYKFFKKEVLPEDLLETPQLLDFEGMDEYSDLMQLTTAPGKEDTMEAAKSPERVKVEDFVDRNPEMVASLLRSWLSEEGGGRGGRH